MPYQRSNLTNYDWAAIRVEFMRTRLLVEEWMTGIIQGIAVLLAAWMLKEYAKSDTVFAWGGFFAVVVVASMWRSSSLRQARSRLDQAEKTCEFYWDDAERED